MRDLARSLSAAKRAYVDEALAIGSVSNIVVVTWRGEKTPERAASERRSVLAITSEHPGDTFALFVIKPSAPPPNEAMRRVSAQMVRAAEQDLRAVAVVIEGTGFTAAVARAVLTALELLTGGHTFPSKYFSDVHDATRWLVTEGANAGADAIFGAVRMLESAPLDAPEAQRRHA
jgi:hypothetical protein